MRERNLEKCLLIASKERKIGYYRHSHIFQNYDEKIILNIYRRINDSNVKSFIYDIYNGKISLEINEQTVFDRIGDLMDIISIWINILSYMRY